MKMNSIMVTVLALGLSGAAHAAVVGDSLGNSAPLPVYSSWDGNANSLENLLLNRAATDGDGNALNVTGPSSDQVRYQRFALTDYQTEFTFKLLGGVAGYSNILGIYTYDLNVADPLNAALTYTPLYTLHSSPLDSEVQMIVDPGQYMGFYINANGANNSQGIFYSETARNAGLDKTQHHFLLLDSIVSNVAGYTLASEDLPYNPGTGLMGDSDYNDMFVQMSYRQIVPQLPPPPVIEGDPVATPEPASMGLALMGITALTLRVTRRSRRQH